MNVGCIGAGSWGTTLAIHLAEFGHNVQLWAWDAEQRRRLSAERENRAYLPGIPFPATLQVVESLADAVSASVVVIATPTQFIRSTFSTIPPSALDGRIIVSASKGIEQGSLLRISELLAETHGVAADQFVCFSGPSHAEEVSRKIPTLIVSASQSQATAETIRDLFTTDSLRVYSSTDLVGVELGGALKNPIALCAGIIDGLGFGDNTKAALITRALAEMTRIGTLLGADPQTFSGLSGLGDLVVTCFSRHSRNRYVGEQIGKGRNLQEIIAEMQMVAEGVTTTASAYQLAQRHGIELPIINEVYHILFEGKDPRVATRRLMTRETKGEV
ncbi:MAG: NAD(P)-dependent glycerol-3-phosphate dehydrogenase [Armatimonadetes bacterium]|nr:NAD(P)-dependent glycerol-3-phosphate dehydrogenase [Armatimonadota bacterium]